MLLASQAVFYNVVFGLLEGWLTFNWKGGSFSIGKVAHFHLGKLAHFREEIPYSLTAKPQSPPKKDRIVIVVPKVLTFTKKAMPNIKIQNRIPIMLSKVIDNVIV